MPKIYYCNSLLYGIPDKLLNRIQRIQSKSDRVILKLHKFRYITVYKALNDQSHTYVTYLL